MNHRANPDRHVELSPEGHELVDKIVHINRVAKVVKGGRRFGFSAIVVVGDKHGKVGYGMGKAHEVPEAIRKAMEKAKRDMFEVPIIDGTIPHEVIGNFGAGKVVIKPAGLGTGVIAGGAVRALLETVGIENVLTKCIGSRNPFNAIRATADGLKKLRTKENCAKVRGKRAEEI